MGIDLVEGVGTAVITIRTLLGPKKIFLADVAYVLGFYINLACLREFNDRDIWWDNKKNLLYKNDYKTFVYCERYCN